MLTNYLKIALRNLRKQPGYSFINIGGLGLGLACAFMIVLFVQYERSYDHFHEHRDRLYRLNREVVRGEAAGMKSTMSPAGLAPELSARFPEIEAVIRYEERSTYLTVGNESHQAERFAFMDREALQAFTFPLVRGNAATALVNPNSVLLTETTAATLFGDADPIGETISFNGRFDLTVTGILKDLPKNTHLQFDYLAPFTLMKELMGPDALENFTNWNYFTYLLLAPGTDAARFEEKLDAYNAERFGDGDGPPQARFYLQPITDIHFTTDVQWDVPTNIDPKYVYLFSGIAVLILLIACVNFMNLATARAAKRAKEVGVRKVLGAQRGQLVGQFLGESVLLSVVAVGAGLAGAFAFLPTFREIIGSEVTLDGAGVGTVLLLVAIGLAAGVVAGSYPAFYLSAFRPAHVLKGGVTRSSRAALLRRGLIVFQFAISIFLIVGTLTVYRQLQYMRSQELGFDREHVVFAPMIGSIGPQFDTFRQRLLQDPRILSVSRASGLPGRVGTNRGYNWPGAEGQDEQGRSFYTIIADYDYIPTLGLDLVAGRNFSRDVATDTLDAYILNEAAAKMLGWEDPVGKPFRAWDRPMGQVIGVVSDFHFKSLHQAIEPVVLNIIPSWRGTVAIRLAPGNVASALGAIEALWRDFAPGYPFDYTFLDEDFDRLYKAEADLARLFTFFAVIAIFVACLGLFGLASYSAEQRTKEIGVRKVMGASAFQIVRLLSKEFTGLVLVSFVLAAPLAYFAMDRWLEAFAYRTSPGLLTYVLAVVLAFGIALLTVSYQSLKAATTDPVKALRYE